ncbi:MAG: hypothetical protein ACREV9_04175 [Burkholderiales bacterium]
MAQFDQVKHGDSKYSSFVKQGAAQAAVASEKPGKMKRLTLDLPEELHRVIKINAAQEGMTMAEKLRALLTDYYGLKKTDGANK